MRTRLLLFLVLLVPGNSPGNAQEATVAFTDGSAGVFAFALH